MDIHYWLRTPVSFSFGLQENLAPFNLFHKNELFVNSSWFLVKIKDRLKYLAISAGEDEIPFWAARRLGALNFLIFCGEKYVIRRISFTTDYKQQFLNEINYSCRLGT